MGITVAYSERCDYCHSVYMFSTDIHICTSCKDIIKERIVNWPKYLKRKKKNEVSNARN